MWWSVLLGAITNTNLGQVLVLVDDWSLGHGSVMPLLVFACSPSFDFPCLGFSLEVHIVMCLSHAVLCCIRVFSL
ncbi:hypothetical protein AALP_AA1G175200 [Arabis alpina]|uniref:Uncharacterized protein n=1 Tax=Arabis alpina TaxID=50452 RepID=A0A087HNV4_ARAAL|nr:hypothetical protein AALP_AA1G175200 [Arabis alpina]